MKPKPRILLTLLLASLAINLLFLALSSQPSQEKSHGTCLSADGVDWRKLHPDLVRLVAQIPQKELIPFIAR